MLRDERGITLLELLVALVITALLGIAIYNVSKMAMDAWQKGEARTQVYQNLRIAINRVSEEIGSAITLNPTYNPAKKIYFYGQSNRLDFISIAHAPIGNYYDSVFTSPPELVFDCCEIGYRVSGTTIYRRKQEKNVPDSDIKAGGTEKEMATHITNLSLTYYSADGSSKTSWDADPTVDGGLPKKVAISITAKSESTRYPNERTFSTWVSLSGR
ncbi:prepilin-type N-terminal cleavage/methylation domain-containing protein [bacterium]|nr:prepilin-type N-terminal cleavage/methylation domain-containing protein [bacterium]